MNGLPTIGIRYTCGGCGVIDREVQVTKRRADQDVVNWVKVVVTSHISVDHRRQSKFCTQTVMSNIKIPLPADDEQLGGSR